MQRAVVSFKDHHERKVRSFLHQNSNDDPPSEGDGAEKDDTETVEDEVELYFDQSTLHHAIDEPMIEPEALEPTSCTLVNNPELNKQLKSELDEKRNSSVMYKKMMVSWKYII